MAPVTLFARAQKSGRSVKRGCPIVVAMLPLALGACDAPPEQVRSPPSAQQVRSTVIRWMECNDCKAGELDSVVVLGAPAIPILARFLIEGPPPDRRTAFELRLDSTYRRREERGAALAMTRRQFTATYLRGFDVGYQERSARALGKIDGPGALDTLRAAPYDSAVPAVRTAIRCALDSLCRR